MPKTDAPSIIGTITSKTLARELTKESIIELHNHVLQAARRGVSFVTEKSSGHMVWNYSTNSMRLHKVKEEGDFTKYLVSLNTQGGKKYWEYILKSDADGNPIDAHAIGTPADFVWRSERSISVPLFKNDDGRYLYNSAA